MTLGDIFGKLSGIQLRAILKWYGRFVFFTFVAGIAILASYVIGMIFVWWFFNVPWPLTLGIVIGITGFIATKIADPDWFKSEQDREFDALRAGDTSLTDTRQKVVSDVKVVNNWQHIRELVATLSDTQGCYITVEDKVYDFENRQDALDFLDGKIAATKSL